MKLKHLLVLDIESYYDRAEVSLRKLSVPEYIWHPKFQVHLLAAYDPTWPAPKIVLPHEIPAFLAQYPAQETISVSHNAIFDASVLSWRYGYVPALMLDTLGLLRALRNYPRNSLGEAAKALLGHNPKGDVIHKVASLDPQGIKNAGLWPEYCTYAMQDALTCFHIFKKLKPEFPAEEMQIMDLVLRAAVVPRLRADVPMLEAHLEDLRKRKATLLRESGYDKAALMSARSFQEALESLGVDVKVKISATNRSIPAFAKSDKFMADLLEYNGSHDDDINYAVQTLAAARLSQKSTIEETRAQRFLDIARLPWGETSRGAISRPLNESSTITVCSGGGKSPLLPVALRYGGAHTHRLSGEWKMNMQNLPRDKARSKLRAAVTAPPGHKLITGDLAQIEARITAKLCGQNGLVQSFRRGDDVYAEFAQIVFNYSVNKKDQPLERFIGKTAILGLGYGCGPDRFQQMVVTQARQNGIALEKFSKEFAERVVHIYRKFFPRIKDAWFQLDRLLAHTINNSTTQWVGWPDSDAGPLKFKSGTILLPNKMTLRYTLNDPKLYGAKLLENIVQALARIVVMQAAVRLARRGYRMVLQSHDELLFAVPENTVKDARLIISEEMVREPRWMPGLPLAVEIGEGDNYGNCKS